MREEEKETLQKINDLIQLFVTQDNEKIVGVMKEIVPEFISNNSNFEKLDK